MQDCDKDSKSYFQNQQMDFESQQREFDKNFAQRKAQELDNLNKKKKELNKKKKDSDNCNKAAAAAAALGALAALAQRMIPCPCCSSANKVKDKIGGKNYFAVPFTDFKVPRFDHLIDKVADFDSNRREGEKCKVCDGKKQIPDATDDSAKYQAAAEKVDKNAEKIMEREALLGLGGTRTTYIQGSDLLFVGLGFNNNKTYETIPGGAIAPTMAGGKIPQQGGVPANAIVGKQGSLAWPQQVGNYTIKCANKFNLLAGAGGITIATPGPLTFSAGMLRFTGPQLALGCSNGPLTLEGETVNVTGKAISVTPTGGEFFVKGNINNTGNMTVQGHAHFESMSFTKASCIGITKSTFMAKANPDVLQTQPATWGSKALTSALLDLQTYVQAIPMDSKTSGFRSFSPKEGQNLADRLGAIASLALPWELKKTGYILPGTKFNASTVSGHNNPNPSTQVTIQVDSLVELHNIPHVHGIPEMMHKHEITLPDMDYTNDTPQALRGKVLNGAHESGVPAEPTKDTVSRLAEVKRTAVEFAAAAKVEGTKLIAKAERFLGGLIIG